MDINVNGTAGGRADVNPRFFTLGSWVARHPWRIVGAWLVLIAVGAWGAHRLPAVTIGGSGGITGSASRAAADVLRDVYTI